MGATWLAARRRWGIDHDRTTITFARKTYVVNPRGGNDPGPDQVVSFDATIITPLSQNPTLAQTLAAYTQRSTGWGLVCDQDDPGLITAEANRDTIDIPGYGRFRPVLRIPLDTGDGDLYGVYYQLEQVGA